MANKDAATQLCIDDMRANDGAWVFTSADNASNVTAGAIPAADGAFMKGSRNNNKNSGVLVASMRQMPSGDMRFQRLSVLLDVYVERILQRHGRSTSDHDMEVVRRADRP